MKLKIKNYIIVFFRITLMLASLLLPFVFTNGAYQNMTSKGHYLWFSYFIIIFLFGIFILIKKNYYELVVARIHNEKLICRNLLFIRKTFEPKDILGYKNGIDDDGKQYVSIYTRENKKIATLKNNIYSNLPAFVDALNCENIGIEFTPFQKIIMKIKKLFKYRN